MLGATKIRVTDEYLASMESLLESAPHGVHLQRGWLASWLTCFENSAFALDVRDSRQTVGTLLLNEQRLHATRFWTSRRFIPAAFGPSDFFAIPYQSGQERRTARGLAGWFRHNPLRWDSLRLDLIPESSTGWREFVDEMEKAGFFPQVTRERRFYRIDTRSCWEDYERGFLHGKLADLRNRRNRLSRAGFRVEVKIIEHGIADYLDGMLPLYQQRRLVANQANVFKTHPAMESFLRTVIDKYEHAGWARLSMLVSDVAILAYQLDWIHNHIWYHYMPAFDDRFAEYSPGKILLYETVKMAFADPNIHEFNFMRGESTYKTQFADQSEPFISIQVENPRSLRLKVTRLAAKLADWRDRMRT